MKTIPHRCINREVQLPIPETSEELEQMVGKNWIEQCAMSFHYRVTLPALREQIVANAQVKTGKLRGKNETEVAFLKRVGLLKT